MRKITKEDLDDMFSAAKRHYVTDSAEFLTPQSFVAQCYVKAIAGFLKVDVELPNRVIVESIDDVNG